MRQICGLNAEEFYEQYYSYIYNYFFYRSMQKQISEDLTSETMLRVIKYADGYNPGISKLITWIMAIARNVMFEFYKNNKKNESVLDIEKWKEILEDENVPDPDEKLNMLFLLDKLGERERNIIYLRYYLELSYKEIADSLSITEKNVSVILTRTLKKLKKLLNEDAVMVK